MENESCESSRLSPIMKKWPGGTVDLSVAPISRIAILFGCLVRHAFWQVSLLRRIHLFVDIGHMDIGSDG